MNKSLYLYNSKIGLKIACFHPGKVEVAEKLKVMDKKIFTSERMGWAQVF